jgi:hypothetical protein
MDVRIHEPRRETEAAAVDDVVEGRWRITGGDFQSVTDVCNALAVHDDRCIPQNGVPLVHGKHEFQVADERTHVGT